MVDRWNLSDLLVYSTNPHTFSLTANKQKYTLGTGGDFDIPRPSRIERVSILIPGSNNYNIELPIDATFDLEQWQSLVVKSTPSAFPLSMWNNTGYPFMELNFWPIPQQTCSVVLYTWDLMPQMVNLSNQIELPTGYSDAIIYNLAVRLAQLFDRVPTPSLVAEAKQAKADINDINAGTPAQHLDPMWSGNNSASSSIAAKSWGRVAL